MLNLHAILPRSRANGPGMRTVIWFQGCSLKCPGCFNPTTHPFEPRVLVSPKQLVAQLAADQEEIEGVTISGGEPFQQAEELLELVTGVRRQSRLSVIVFSGYPLEDLLATPIGGDILTRVDVLIDGCYEQAQRVSTGLRGSANQRLHLLSDR